MSSVSDPQYQLIVVCDITKDDGGQVYANACAVLEDICIISRAEWKVAEGVAIFHGIALKPLSVCSAHLYTDEATKNRVRSLDYREAHGSLNSMVHPQQRG